ncbi:nuclear transport factor 2 family protein [Mycolicibacterium fortuitum]|uniref:nuclear transport factor 2 family protein n=1 Tax=Mycolicibacterium fortuitum TaxID=1766 RepID=UPI000A7DE970|nr:nuclear transport factor 2 family protein [Mycolicibacterium fortuitum]
MSDSGDVMVAVRAYVEAFNAGDAAAMAAVCANPMQILDGMAPHVWQGPAAAEDWYADALAEGEHLGVTDYRIRLADPRHVDVTGENAYVVVPATFSYKVRGTPVDQTDAVFTVALRTVAGGWRLTAWAWSKGNM